MRLSGRLSVGSISRYVPHFIVSSVVAASVVAASGCGSGSGDPNPSPSPSASASPTPNPTPTPTQTTPVTVATRVVWGPRSRQVGVQVNAVGGPSSALSGTITLVGANAAGGDLVIRVDRGVLNGPQDYTSAPQQARPGVYTLNATFYSLNAQQGVVVGTAQASATVLANGTLSTTIATVGKVQSVVVNPSASGGLQTVAVGQTISIRYSALDAAGNVLALTPGSAFVSVRANTLSDGTLDTVTRATANGEDVTGVAPNLATVVVTVDGVSSAPTQISIRSNASLVVTPPGAGGGPVFVGLGLSQTFNAVVTNDGPAGLSGVTWQVLNNGAADTSQNAGTLSTSGPSLSTVFTATSIPGNQTNAANNYVLRVVSVYDPSVFVDIPIIIQDGTLPVIVN